MDSFTLVIFGITSNLAQIKLIPALYDLEEKNLFPQNTKIIGIARSPKSEKEFKDYLIQTLHAKNKYHHHKIDTKVLKRFLAKMFYLPGHSSDLAFYQKLNQDLNKSESKQNRIFYLATYPNLYQEIFENLKKSGLADSNKGWVRLMIEKPIGHDQKSARKLNSLLTKYFDESQIYRLDHYLGKETLQNILSFRFGNELFEPLMNSKFIDHIQITALEDYGVGLRGGYYDAVGALKDVGQNHQLQMITLATMNSPKKLEDKAITKERVRILKNLIPLPDKLVLGQYRGYQDEANVDKNSTTDTFYAFKTYLGSKKFADVPIYVRAGKMLSQTVTEIVIVFKTPFNRLFKNLQKGQEPNILIFRIYPNEGIVFEILTKKPGPKMELEPDFMQFCYKTNVDLSHHLPDPYDRLISDVIIGDQTFFNDAAEIEAEWKFVDKLLEKKQPQPFIYEPGSWGPKEADKLIEKDGRKWLEPSMDFCRI